MESLDYEAMEAAHSDNEVEPKLEDKEAQNSQKRVESKADGESSDDSSGKGILVLSTHKKKIFLKYFCLTSIKKKQMTLK